MAKATAKTFSAVALATLSTISWMFFSSALIILNKDVYQLGFQRPFFVTGMGQLFSLLGGLALVYSGCLPLRKLPNMRFVLLKLLPIAASSTTSMFFGNYAYLYLSVAFIQILKAFTPALTLMLCVIFGLERLHWPLVLSTMLIALGTASVVMVESGTPAFSSWGLLSFLISSLAEAARVVGAEVLLGSSQRFNSAEALVYVGGPTAILLLIGSFIWEDMGPTSDAWTMLATMPWSFFAAFAMSFLVNLSCFFAIQYTSSLTFKVAGCVKNIVVVWYGVAAHNEHVSPSQMIGYLVSVAGFAMYSKLKMTVQGSKASSKGTGHRPKQS